MGKICGKSIVAIVSFPVTEIPLKEVYLYQIQHRVLQSCCKTEDTLGTALLHQHHVLFEPLAQGGSSPIQGRWKKHNLEFFVHTESKKVSSSFGYLSKSLLLHHLFPLQNPHSGVECSMEFTLSHVPAIVLAFFFFTFFFHTHLSVALALT